MRFLAENEMKNKTISQMSVYGYFVGVLNTAIMVSFTCVLKLFFFSNSFPE
jgi:hypothetical protein